MNSSSIGLKVAPLAAAQAPSEVKGFGRVLDPAPLAALVTEGAIGPGGVGGFHQGIRETQDPLLAESECLGPRPGDRRSRDEKDRIALESVQSRLLVGWGKEIASQPDVGPNAMNGVWEPLQAFVASLVAQQAALIRVDLPLGE